MWVKFAQACLTLCDPKDCSPPNSSGHEILQAGIVEWVAIPFSKGSSQPRDQTHVSLIAGRFFTIWATWKSKNTGVGSLSFTMGSSQPRNRSGVSCIAGRFFTSWDTKEGWCIIDISPTKGHSTTSRFLLWSKQVLQCLWVTEPSVSISLELTLAVEMLNTQPLSKEDVHQGRESDICFIDHDFPMGALASSFLYFSWWIALLLGIKIPL